MISIDSFELEELTFVAGDFFTIEFSVYDEPLGQLASIDDYDVSCVISHYGNPKDIVLTKSGMHTDSGKYQIIFDSDETINLNGKYIYQPILSKSEKRQYRPAQGILTIIPAII